MLKKVPMLCKGVKDEPDNLLDQITDQINPVNTDGHGCKLSSRSSKQIIFLLTTALAESVICNHV